MFANVGGQIKTLAKFCVWLLTIVGVIIGGAVYSLYEKAMDPSVILCLLFLIVGGVVGWLIGYVSAILFYAFGELVQKVQRIDAKLDEFEEE